MAATIAQALTHQPLRVPARRSMIALLPLASIALVLAVLLATLASIAHAPVATGRPSGIGAPPTIQLGSSDVVSAAPAVTMPEHPEPGMDR